MFKNPFSIKFMFLLICFLISTSINKAEQKEANLSIKLISVQEGNKQISDSSWSKLNFQLGEAILFSFDYSPALKEKVFYRIFMDNNIVEAGSLDNYISFKDLVEGVHILKAQVYTSEGIESIPFILSFTISKTQNKAEDAVNQTSTVKGQNILSNPILVYSLISLCIIQFIFVIFRKSGTPKTKKEEDKSGSELKRLSEEYNEQVHLNRRLKDDIKELIEYNEYLKKQKAELEASIKNLEGVNVSLLDQKVKLTESKRQLEMLQTQKEELFAMAIHDIKNPISAIRGYIELLNSYDLNASEQHQIMDSLMASSENIVKLTQSMCTIIAQERPEPALKFSSVSIKKIIDEICNQNMSYAKAKSIKLINKVSTGLPDVQIDQVKISEVIENLVNNAIKYGPPETTVEIRTFVKNKLLTVEVQDNGVGIPEEDLKRAFQKGAVLSPTPTGVEQSSGLGLWIVKRIIVEHNGKVWVHSKVGAGSTFGFELPMETQQKQ